MSDYQIGMKEKEDTSPLTPHDKEPPKEPVNRVAHILGNLLDHSDGIIGISFLIGALFALSYSFWDVGTMVIGKTVSESASIFALAIIKFISDPYSSSSSWRS